MGLLLGLFAADILKRKRFAWLELLRDYGGWCAGRGRVLRTAQRRFSAALLVGANSRLLTEESLDLFLKVLMIRI